VYSDRDKSREAWLVAVQAGNNKRKESSKVTPVDLVGHHLGRGSAENVRGDRLSTPQVECRKSTTLNLMFRLVVP